MDADTLAGRLARLLAFGGIDFKTLDHLAILTEGHAGQIVRGQREAPSGETLVEIGRVLGASVEWLVRGEGREPGSRRVRDAVESARRERVEHARRVATRRRTRKRNARTGDASAR